MNCKFFHPPGRKQAPSQPDNRMKPDCRIWMEGWCRKVENLCRGKHEQGKFGTQAKQPMPTTSSNMDFNNPDFVQALTKVVSQTLAGAKSAAPGPSGGQQQVFPQPSGGQQQVFPQPSGGQQQVFPQPQQQNTFQQNMTNQNQPMLLNNQQPMMMPMMMLPTGQNVFYPSRQGGQGPGQ